MRTGKTGNKSSESLGVTELDGAQAAIERHDCFVLRLRVYGSEVLLLRFCLSIVSFELSDTFVMQGIYALHKRSTLVLLSKLAEDQVNVFAGTNCNRMGYSGTVGARHWNLCALTARSVCHDAAAIPIKRRGK